MVQTSQTYGNYQIDKELGEGGFGKVFLATHRSLGNKVALKVPTHPDYIQALLSEGILHHSLESPYIVKILDLFNEEDPPYIVMEYVAGGSLRDYLKEKGPLSIKEGLTILEQIALAVKTAHQQNIIHGDIKPENILKGEDGYWKLTDFGLSKQDSSFSVEYSGNITATLSKQLNISGTLNYMAPEALEGKATLQSDIYCLGILFFEMVTGSVPQGLDPLNKRIEGNLSEEIELLFTRSYTRQEDRFTSIEDFLTQLSIAKKSATGTIRYGGILPRSSAFILDICLVYFLCLIPFLQIMFLRKWYLFFIPCVLYFTLFHTLSGKTIGKLLFSLRVVKSNFEPLDFITAFYRSVLMLPSALSTLGIYPAFLDPNRRTLHDLACNTVVIDER